ncbi:MAG: DUF3987 domain-containing protein [Verrucomicrobia bacterium]|nr:DUF3987 domain-containing protein [Verrucomicrobiota bacterium]
MTSEKSEFPFDVLPPMLSEITDELANAYSAPKEILASSAISILGMCLGRGVALRTDDPEPTYGLLYMYLGALPGVGKRSIKALMKPVDDYVYEQRQRQRTQVEAELRQEFEGRGKEPSLSDISKRIGKDFPTLYTSMFTEEGLAQLLMRNKEYVFLHSTEAAGVVKSIIGQGRQQNTSTNLLKHCYVGDSFFETYKSSEEAHLKEPRMGVLLLSTPSTLGMFMQHSELLADGTISRFLFDSSEQRRRKRDRVRKLVNAKVHENWENLTKELLGRFAWKDTPKAMISITEEAMQLRLDLDDEMVEMNNSLSNRLVESGITNRTAENAGRIALCLHFARYGLRALDRELDKETMKAGISLARYYFNKTCRKLEEVFSDDYRIGELQNMLLEYLKDEPVSLRDLHKDRVVRKCDRYLLNPLLAEGTIVAWNESSGNKPSICIGISESAYIPDDIDFILTVD